MLRDKTIKITKKKRKKNDYEISLTIYAYSVHV